MRSLVGSILVLSFALLAAAQVSKKCSAPPKYPHTRLASKYAGRQRFNIGEKVYYDCEEDFTASRGLRAVQCTDRGQWTKLTLKCEKRTCGNAGELLNGQFQYEGETFIGEKVYAVCNEGYTVKGLNYMVCKKSGWTGDFPTCEEGEPTCSRPVVANSVNSSADVPGVYQVGDSLTFTCSQGFQLDGAQQITCRPDGQWQPQLPLCLPETPRPAEPETPRPAQPASPRPAQPATPRPAQPATPRQAQPATPRQAQPATPRQAQPATPRQAQPTTPLLPDKESESPSGGCGVPVTSSNSHAHLTDKYILKTSFASGDRVYYECDVGYAPAGGSRLRVCGERGWTPLRLRCERKTCGSAGEIFNGQFIYTGVEFGDTATALCDEGHRLVGQGTRNCLSRGWDGRIPVCEAVDCGEPPAVKNADTEGRWEQPYTYRTVIRYQCRVGTPKGSSEIWCTEDGTWSTPPTCKEMTCRPPNVPGGFWTGARNKSYQYRDTIAIECDRGYTRSGPGMVTCGSNGRWHPNLPKCRPAFRSRSGHYRRY